MDFELSARRKDPTQPQLTAMIDVFSIIIIFLVAGTVFGTSSILLPKNVSLPKSFGKESIVSAPQLTIADNGVKTTFSNHVYPLGLFKNHSANDPELATLTNEVKLFIKNLRPEVRSSGVLLNVVADKALPYKTLFDVVSVYRSAGFESLLFISEGEKEGGDGK